MLTPTVQFERSKDGSNVVRIRDPAVARVQRHRRHALRFGQLQRRLARPHGGAGLLDGDALGQRQAPTVNDGVSLETSVFSMALTRSTNTGGGGRFSSASASANCRSASAGRSSRRLRRRYASARLTRWRMSTGCWVSRVDTRAQDLELRLRAGVQARLHLSQRRRRPVRASRPRC